VLAAECTGKIARLLGHRGDEASFRQFRRELTARIQERLWDEKAGIFKSRTWSGRFVEALTPVNFYPMLAGRKGIRHLAVSCASRAAVPDHRADYRIDLETLKRTLGPHLD